MIDRVSRRDCSGCGACRQACPAHGIDMRADREGFLFPEIDASRCAQCDRCAAVCPSLASEGSMERSPRHVYACWHRDEDVRRESTSGGAFSALASRVLEDGGLVCGAAYADDFSVHHRLIDRVEDLPRLRQSKYMQSDVRDVYARIAERARGGTPVLFCGTPCQNAALGAVVGGACDNLYRCDFICHGVTSPMVFQAYRRWLEAQYGSPATHVRFRSKEQGWNHNYTEIVFENGERYVADRHRDPYMLCYLRYNLGMRRSCHACRHKGLGRHSDITLGDFWGVSRVDPALDADRGTSVCMIHTRKGQALFERVADRMVARECAVADVLPGNPYLMASAREGRGRDAFFRDIEGGAFDVVVARYGEGVGMPSR